MAVDEFQAFLRDFPENAHVRRRSSLAARPSFSLAGTTMRYVRFDQMLDRYPANRFARQAMFRRAEAAYVSGQHKRARTLLDEFHVRYPDDEFNEYVLPYLAELMLDEHGAQDARKLFAQAVDTYPQGR